MAVTDRRYQKSHTPSGDRVPLGPRFSPCGFIDPLHGERALACGLFSARFLSAPEPAPRATATPENPEVRDPVQMTPFEVSGSATAATVKLNVTHQQMIDSNLAPDVTRYVGERLAVWQAIIDPLTLTGRPWYTERYNAQMSAKEFVDFNVVTPLGLALAGNGLSRPQIRKYRANFMTNSASAASPSTGS